MHILFVCIVAGFLAFMGMLHLGISLFGYKEEEFTQMRPPVSRMAPAVGIVYAAVHILLAVFVVSYMARL